MLVRRESRTGANDLNTVYRPCTVGEMLGNSTNVNMIRKGLDERTLPHTLLFTGDPGCGKTTAARIIALGLNCEHGDSPTPEPCLECISCKSILNQNSMDVTEINVAQTGGKDHVDKIVRDLPSAPFGVRYKVVIFDEAHRLTDAAQKLLLKVIEDGFSHVYFIFCTNKPEKLRMAGDTAFIDRCPALHFGRISGQLLLNMLENVAQFEGMEYKNDVLGYIAKEARGVPRNALVWLKQVSDEGSWTIEVAREITGSTLGEDDPNIIEISKALIKGSFKNATTVYDKVKKKSQAESVRLGVVSYLVGCLKRAKSYSEADKFSAALDVLTQPIYEQGKPGDWKFYHMMYKTARLLKK
jgi:DNA polymerase-3 subunit gamma/tau